jgi:hypothetical protein
MALDEQKNRQRLFTLDASLREEADIMLEESGLGRIIEEEGFKPVGSYAMKTMAWRNLDFERTDDNPVMKQHWELGARFARTGWVWGLSCINAYLAPRGMGDEGLYWGLRMNNHEGGDTWKLDLWTARAEEYEPYQPKRDLWESRLNEDTRYEILVIKEAVCNLPEYRNSLLSIHIYEAVLENGVRGIDEFWKWWKKYYGK